MISAVCSSDHEPNFSSLSADQIARRLEQLRARMAQVVSLSNPVQDERRGDICSLIHRIGRLEHELVDRMIRAEQVALSRLRDGSDPARVGVFRAMPDEITRHHVLPFLEDWDLVSLAEASETGMSAEARRVLEETWVALDKSQTRYPALGAAYQRALNEGAHENPGERLKRFQFYLCENISADLSQPDPQAPQLYHDFCRKRPLTRLGSLIREVFLSRSWRQLLTSSSP
jgi:hypothetical protein